MEKFYYTKVFKREKYIHLRTLDVDQHINTVKAAPKQHLLLTKNKGLPHYLFFSVCCFFVQTELRVMMEHVWFITVTHNSIGQHWYITCHPLPQTSK